VATRSQRGRKAPPRARRRPLASGAPTVGDRAAGERFELAMRAINEGVYDWDLAGNTMYYSERVYAVLGIPPNVVRTPKDWRRRIHPDDLGEYDRRLIDHFKGRRDRFECDYRYRDGDGAWRWARQHGIAVRDARGRAVRMVGSTGDITDMKRVEQALKESQDRYALATQAATEGIYEWNLGTGALYLSERAKEFFAVRGTALTPASWNRRVHKHDFPGYRAALANFFKDREAKYFEHEYRIRDAAGGYAWIDDRAVAERDGRGRVLRLIGALNDVTERKQHELDLARARDEATEALERQTATAEILKVIAASPSDVQPVFDVIATCAMRLIGGFSSTVARVVDGTIHLVALTSTDPAGDKAVRAQFPQALAEADGNIGRAIKRKSPYLVRDTESDPDLTAVFRKVARARGFRSVIAVPMLRAGEVIGVVSVARSVPGDFPPAQVELLKTFADQAVIAIENVRLFNETKEALERQTAVSEILEKISRSPTDVAPVLNAVAERAAHLCEAEQTTILLTDGSRLRHAVTWSKDAGPLPDAGTVVTIDRRYIAGRAVLERRIINLEDALAELDAYPLTVENQRKTGYRSFLAVPLMRESKAIGVAIVWRRYVRKFSDRHVALAKTFADQAAIAIENVRLFNETREALERQTATAEILKVIAGSPSDVQPVFDAILQSAVNLCGAEIAAVFPYDGKLVHLGATYNWSEEATRYFAGVYPAPPSPGLMSGRTILGKSIVMLADAAADKHYDPKSAATGQWRRMLGVPIMREGEPLGALVVCWRDPGETPQRQVDLLQIFADQAAIAIENVRLFNETREALERQTATAEILKVIASSPSDVQPVFDAIVGSVLKLMAGTTAHVARLEGDTLHLVAFSMTDAEGEAALKRLYPLSLAGTPYAATLLEQKAVFVSDVETDTQITDQAREAMRARGVRSSLRMPMIFKGASVGVIVVNRKQAGQFSDHEIELLKTFANQAVIAVENVRLFNETRESLERQTATAEILKVIASSPSDVQPVFDAIVETAKRLIGAFSATVTHVGGGMLHLVAHTSTTAEGAEALNKFFPIPVEGTPMGRSIQSRRPSFVDNFETDPDIQDADRELARSRGFGSVVFVPLLRGGDAIGSLNVTRREAGRMSDHQVELLKTFADQAVIAIENVRLFNETKESLERQTATAEILRVIAGSPTDVQPVFDAIAVSARRLLGARQAVVSRRIGDTLHLAAHTTTTAEGDALLKQLFPTPITGQGVMGKAVMTRHPFFVADVETDPAYSEAFRAGARARGVRAMLSVPMLREGEAIGVINVTRSTPGPFPQNQIDLLKTFADQAVIAIENVRLFNETKEALARQTATAEILRVIGGSMTDTQPVFDAIVKNCNSLFDDSRVVLRLVIGEQLHVQASIGGSGGALPIDRTSVAGACVTEGRTIHLPDLEAASQHHPQLRNLGLKRGERSGVYAPLLRAGKAIGSISVLRRTLGAFSEKEVALLNTFADQAVIAIENVRLFNETKEALERQTATAEILKVISQSTTDVQPVLEAIVRSAAKLFPQCNAFVFMRDGDLVRLRAMEGVTVDARLREDLGRIYPVPFDPAVSTSARAMAERRPNACADTEAPDVPEHIREAGRAARFRSNIVVPLVRDDEGIGTIVLTDPRPGYVLDGKQLALLKTFADQAVIAIENVRLFNETKEALEQQTATAEILKVISESPTDTQPVFNAIVQAGLRLFPSAVVVLAIPGGAAVRAAAIAHADPAMVESMRTRFPVPLLRDRMHAAAILDGALIDFPDAEAEKEGRYSAGVKNFLASGFRAITIVPMICGDSAIGAISVNRLAPGPLSEKQVALLRTFAAQAVIAIENVRVFKELEARTGALTRSVEQLTALGEVGQAISSTLDLQTVLNTIVQRAVQLTGLDGGAIYEYDERSEEFQVRATENLSEELVQMLRETPAHKGEGVIGLAVETGQPTEIPEMLDDSYQSPRRDSLIKAGYRALLVVPLVREEHIIGALTVNRRAPGMFSNDVIELLKTFATQSAMAIQNARLFREIAEKGKQLEVASQHKSNFLASMSHELRTPLNAILGFNELILGQVYGEVPGDMKEPLEDIQKSGKHLLRLINNVLDLAKIEAGRMELSLQDYSVHDTVESVRATLRPLAMEKGLNFPVTLPPDLPLAHGDPGRITQCLMNLAGNSIKFTEAGKVEISVAERDGLLTFRVDDTGIGIPPEKIASLFQEFKQTDATIASTHGGTGLGLAISKKFVEMHGGRIWIESELGRGSAFIFEIPLRVSP